MSQKSEGQDTRATPAAEGEDVSRAAPVEDAVLVDATEEVPSTTADDDGLPAKDDSQPKVDPQPGSPPETGPQPERAAPRVTGAGAGAGTMIIGGVLAAAIGAAAALVLLPEGWRRGETAALADRIAAIEARPAGLTAADLQAAIGPLAQRVAAIESSTQLSDLKTEMDHQIAALQARITALEARPAGATAQDIAAAIAPLSTRLDQLEANLDSQVRAQARSAVDAALADARAQLNAEAQAVNAQAHDVATAQERIAARAALAELVAAAQSGAPAPGPLATVTAALGNDPALAPFAQGLVTLTALQDSFPAAARAALAAQPPAANASLGERVLDFLRSQTGARSLAPHAGNSTDAVLSRAEAALRSGDLASAVSTLDALSGPPAQAMADWRAQAQTRLDALAALQAAQTRLTGNEG